MQDLHHQRKLIAKTDGLNKWSIFAPTSQGTFSQTVVPPEIRDSCARSDICLFLLFWAGPYFPYINYGRQSLSEAGHVQLWQRQHSCCEHRNVVDHFVSQEDGYLAAPFLAFSLRFHPCVCVLASSICNLDSELLTCWFIADPFWAVKKPVLRILLASPLLFLLNRITWARQIVLSSS